MAAEGGELGNGDYDHRFEKLASQRSAEMDATEEDRVGQQIAEDCASTDIERRMG